MPSKSSDKPATRGDLARTGRSLRQGIARLDGRTAKLDKKLDDTAGRLDKKIDDTAARLDKKIDDSTKRLALAIVDTNRRIDDLDDKLSGRMAENHRVVVTMLERQTQLLESTHRAVTIHGRVLTEHDQRISALEARR